ncbi:ABC transporter ATP-binding protein [Halopelagius longus]|uniref:ABC transporter ATP-binding protein n=1 Tax=Halopelagius longus TaxID=1236180 RepID=A0A1H0XQK4_9EURY|nr:ABC transporter ATP-binding protein [Halopelagius longus]RDI72023.1 ABC transporter ATP-binding protein [Halopelagius longus]SDQ05180.1 ATP-binding cassette, subfamily B [Halopelagius longus]
MTADDESAFDRLRAEVDRPLTRLFREYGASRKRWLALGLAANLLAQTASLVPPVVLGTAIDAVFGSQTTPYALPLVPAAWIPTTPEAQFWFSAWLIVGAFATAAVCTWVYGVTANFFAHDVMHAVRTDSFEKLLRLDMQFFDDKQTGEVMAILNNDAGNLEVFLDNALMNSLRLLVMVGGIAFILFSLNPQLALVTLVVVPGLVGFTLWFMRAVAPRYRARQSAVASFNTRIENGIGGVELVKTTNSESFESGRVRDSSADVYETTMSVLKLSYLYRPGMELLAGLSFAATFVVGGYWLLVGAPGPLAGELSVGTFVTFIFMTQRFVAPLAEVSNIVDQVQNARASAERVFGLADIPVHIEDRPDAVALSDPEGRVEYESVSFAYSDPVLSDGGDSADGGDDPPVLEDVSFDAAPGETVAFVGPTGAGKSTLAKLLLRLYDPTAGSVRLDGEDVRAVTLDSLRNAVGYVSQDTHLFDGTIAENVRYGRFDASDEAVREAAEAAEAHEFIADMPEGYETRVGERGVKLSGGQRQRIALARAVLHDPPVLVLDEATSAVDTETERAIQRSLDRLAEDRTTLVIAHRLSTVVDADEILVLEDGRVVERGTHDDLLARGGRYASLWRAQTNGR